MTALIKTRLKIGLVVIGVFLLGCITGVSLDSVYRLRTRADQQRDSGKRDSGAALEHMKRDLKLNEQQTTDIKVILDQTGNDYRALRGEVRPRYDAIRQSARTRIRAMLTPEQQQLFDAKEAERDARRESKNKNDVP